MCVCVDLDNSDALYIVNLKLIIMKSIIVSI